MNSKKSLTKNSRNKSFLLRLVAIGILACWILSFNKLDAQIAAPGLYCIKNDTLLWNLPSVSCGTITAYEIYYSESKTGPYTLLTQISNPNQISYFHSVPGKNFYYYMTTLANCTGQISLHSDTLDNFDPPVIPIESIDVAGGKCLLKWKLPVTTKQLSYIIYRSTPNGTIPIDTVSNTDSYLDQSSNPLLKPEAYYILALDPCGNASIFDKPHFSIFSEIAIDTCKRSLDIKWSPYENWINGVQEYQVWVGLNGSAPAPVATTLPSVRTYTVQDLNDGDKFCIFIRAVQALNGITASSNEHCFDVKIVQPVKWLQPYAVSVLPDNSIDLKWSWNTSAEIKSAEIFSSSGSKNIYDLTGFSFTFPLSKLNTFNYTGKNPALSSVNFKIKTTDLCNTVVESSPIGSIFLKGTANQDKSNTLSWSFQEPTDVTILEYEVNKIINGVETIGGTITNGIGEFSDKVDIDNPYEEKICYYITARVRVKLGDSSVVEDIIRSNTVCVNQFATLIFPNALIPDGLNNEFKPVSVFAQNAVYSLVIYDRWGQKVFETNDINKAWKGKKNNDALPAGMYVYLAKLIQPNGRVEEKKGEVMLIR